MTKHEEPRILVRGIHTERSRPLSARTVARIACGVTTILEGLDQIQREAIKEITKTPSQ